MDIVLHVHVYHFLKMFLYFSVKTRRAARQPKRFVHVIMLQKHAYAIYIHFYICKIDTFQNKNKKSIMIVVFFFFKHIMGFSLEPPPYV